MSSEVSENSSSKSYEVINYSEYKHSSRLEAKLSNATTITTRYRYRRTSVIWSFISTNWLLTLGLMMITPEKFSMLDVFGPSNATSHSNSSFEDDLMSNIGPTNNHSSLLTNRQYPKRAQLNQGAYISVPRRNTINV